MSATTCPQCGHDAHQHWPDHGKTTSACGVCIEPPVFYTRREGQDGAPYVCCWPANDLRNQEPS